MLTPTPSETVPTYYIKQVSYYSNLLYWNIELSLL